MINLSIPLFFTILFLFLLLGFIVGLLTMMAVQEKVERIMKQKEDKSWGESWRTL